MNPKPSLLLPANDPSARTATQLTAPMRRHVKSCERCRGFRSQLRANIQALPGFGEMKVKSLGAVLAKRYDVAAAHDLVPWHPTLGDVDSHQALLDYQAAKREHKALWSST